MNSCQWYMQVSAHVPRFKLVLTFFSAFPWLLIPALSLVSLAGLVLLITNLQVANLFGEHRYTVMATFIGAYHACSVIMTCMKVKYVSISLVFTWKRSFNCHFHVNKDALYVKVMKLIVKSVLSYMYLYKYFFLKFLIFEFLKNCCTSY